MGFLRWSGMQDRFEVWRVDGSRWGRKWAWENGRLCCRGGNVCPSVAPESLGELFERGQSGEGALLGVRAVKMG